MTKPLLRTQVRQSLSSFSPADRPAASAAACDLLFTQQPFLSSRTFLFYIPLKDELDLRPCAAAALASGKRVALPRFDPSTQTYQVALVDCPLDQLPTGQFGIPEPACTALTIPLNELDFALVPGLAFDPAGRRLGRGKGFYDRLLAEVRGIKCGVALDQQILAEIPFEPHDVVMDFILTPTRWLTARAAK